MTSVPCARATNLDRAFRVADAVINCAGPFAATAVRVIESAIRAGIPYLDVTAEVEVVTDTFASYAQAEMPIGPAAAFYGGLGDLLAAAAMGDWPMADHLTIAYALSSWRPTLGTRATGVSPPSAGVGGGLPTPATGCSSARARRPAPSGLPRRPSVPVRSSARSRWPTARPPRRIWTSPRSLRT